MEVVFCKREDCEYNSGGYCLRKDITVDSAGCKSYKRRGSCTACGSKEQRVVEVKERKLTLICRHCGAILEKL